MAQEIMVMGAIYEDVPSVRLPDSNGTFHPFTDTSDTTAVAGDVAQGKTFHLADGTLATGTASGGGGGDDYHPAAINDGNTYLYIEIPNEKLKTVPLTMRMKNGSMTIDWGDGSAPEHFIAAVTTRYEHRYAGIGRFVIKLSPDAGSSVVFGGGTTETSLFGTGSVNSSPTNTSLLPYAIEIGSAGCTADTLSAYAFRYCEKLRKVTLCEGVSVIGNNCFSPCYSLDDLTLPETLETVGSSAFQASALTSLVFPSSVRAVANPFTNIHRLTEAAFSGSPSISGRLLSGCLLLEELIIPESVTQIEDYGFVSCPSMMRLHFRATTPPTAKPTAFSYANFPTSCTIYVPAGSLGAYTSASNYPSPSTYTYVEE